MSLRLGLPIAAALVAADQFSKWFILDRLQLDDVGQIPGFQAGPFGLDLTMVWNRGVTFGMLTGQSSWHQVALSVLALGVAVFLLRWMARAENRLTAAALGAVVGGAIGNVIDRLRFGAVVDFVDVHAWDWHWYVFNLADAAIVCGVGVLVIDALLRPSPTAKTQS
ncbi:MAG: signal peptidase [Rhodospirillales bacterium]|jgi:lipoprotein signal peptidase|nr:signal peptidase [Rhodospirillales bacterium]MDB5384035.1 signal peptidase [Rhodospirillales bacterium]